MNRDDLDFLLLYAMLALALYRINRVSDDVERLAARVDNPPVVQLDRSGDAGAALQHADKAENEVEKSHAQEEATR